MKNSLARVMSIAAIAAALAACQPSGSTPAASPHPAAPSTLERPRAQQAQAASHNPTGEEVRTQGGVTATDTQKGVTADTATLIDPANPHGEYYTEGTQPAGPGTACGAATRKVVVIVVSGTISCTDALAVMDGYMSRPNPANQYGAANIQQFGGWQCSTNTAIAEQTTGWSRRCTNGNIDLQTL